MTDNLVIRYVYEFMPKGIVTQFIVVMHNYIFNKDCVWKSGVVLEKEAARAEIIEYYGKRELQIRITGGNKKELMAIVTYELSKIHNTYKRLKYNELVPCKCKTCRGNLEPHFYALRILKQFAQDNQSIQCQKSYEMIDAKIMLDDVLSRDVLRKQSEYTNDNKSISFEGANINQLIVQQAAQAEIDMIHQARNEENMPKRETAPKSAWANGLFYLFAFVVVIAGLGVLANSVPWYTFALILVAAVIFVPLIGALQLRQDKSLSEKGFLELIGMVLRQLPIIERLYKK